MKNGDKVFKIVLIFASIISVSVIGFYIFQFATEPLSADNGTWGQFGDYVGGTLNPVFGFLSLVILLYVLRQNERALDISREELKLTRKELEKSSEALTEQSETLKIQRFEQTFFSLLDLYKKTLSELAFKKYTGREAIDELHKEFPSTHLLLTSKFEKDNYKQIFDELYSKFFLMNKVYFSLYIKVVYSILRFIDCAEIHNKKQYTDLFWVQFSQSELRLIFYNGISSFGGENFYLLIKYKILEHIDDRAFYNKKIDLQIFEDLKQDIELAQTVKERLAENETPIRASTDSL